MKFRKREKTSGNIPKYKNRRKFKTFRNTPIFSGQKERSKKNAKSSGNITYRFRPESSAETPLRKKTISTDSISKEEAISLGTIVFRNSPIFSRVISFHNSSISTCNNIFYQKHVSSNNTDIHSSEISSGNLANSSMSPGSINFFNSPISSDKMDIINSPSKSPGITNFVNSPISSKRIKFINSTISGKISLSNSPMMSPRTIKFINSPICCDKIVYQSRPKSCKACNSEISPNSITACKKANRGRIVYRSKHKRSTNKINTPRNTNSLGDIPKKFRLKSSDKIDSCNSRDSSKTITASKKAKSSRNILYQFRPESPAVTPLRKKTIATDGISKKRPISLGTIIFRNSPVFSRNSTPYKNPVSSSNVDINSSLISESTKSPLSSGNINFVNSPVSSGNINFVNSPVSSGTISFINSPVSSGTISFINSPVSCRNINFINSSGSTGRVKFINSPISSRKIIMPNSSKSSGRISGISALKTPTANQPTTVSSISNKSKF